MFTRHLDYNNPEYSTPQIVCPYCGMGYNERDTEEEYGHFCLPEGKETFIAKCRKEKGFGIPAGCGKEFVVTRNVVIVVSYSDIKPYIRRQY